MKDTYNKEDYQAQIHMLANRMQEILWEFYDKHHDLDIALDELNILFENQKHNPHHKEYIADAINSRITKNEGGLLHEALSLEMPIEILFWFLERGANRTLRDKFGMCPLRILSIWNYLEQEDLNDFFNFKLTE